MSFRREPKGVTMTLVLYIAAFVMVSGALLLNDSSQTLKLAGKRSQTKNALGLANNAITDIMQQFSRFERKDFMNLTEVNRLTNKYSSGDTKIEITPIPAEHALKFTATGFDTRGGKTLAYKKSATGIVQFESDYVKTLTLEGTQAFACDNWTYKDGVHFNGPFWVAGSLTLGDGVNAFNTQNAALGVEFNGGPVLIDGDLVLKKDNMTVNTNMSVQGTIVCGTPGKVVKIKDDKVLYTNQDLATVNCVKNQAGTALPVTVKPYVPHAKTLPSVMDMKYYKNTHDFARVDLVAGDDDIAMTFNQAGTITFSRKPVNLPGAAYTIPENGVVIYGEGINVTVSPAPNNSVVNGKVTLVIMHDNPALLPSPPNYTKANLTAADKGRITIRGDIEYWDPVAGAKTDLSTSKTAFAAIAQNQIKFYDHRSWTTSPQKRLEHGFFYVLNGNPATNEATGTNWSSHDGGGDACNLVIYGTINKSYMAGFDRYDYYFDSALIDFPPPGLPIRSRLVSYNIR